MIEYFQILDKGKLSILKNQTATFEKLNFSFSQDYIKKLGSLLKTRNSIQIMAREKDQFVGYAAAAETMPHFPSYLFLSEIFVNPEYQNKKVGKNLLKQIINHAKKKNLNGIITETEFENIPAQKFYEKNGFVKTNNPKWDKGITFQLNFAPHKK